MNVIWGSKGHKIAGGGPPTALTVGNFDGMHLGHRELVKKVINRARLEKVKSGLMTFDPHPMKILFPEKNVKSIFPLDDRVAVAENLGLDFMIIQSFSRELSELEPAAFFEELLVKKFNVKFLVVGHDFSFGKNRLGTLKILQDLCSKFKVELEILPPVKLGEEVISSSKIRDLISLGQMEKTREFLGRPFYLQGVVEKGAGRGRTIGFPTANLYTTGELFPQKGVYVTSFQYSRGGVRKSVTNVGQNPTFVEATRRPIQVETYIFNFAEDVYGEQAKISFLHFLRPEMKFNSVQELVTQIKYDVEQAEKYPWKNP